MFYDRKKTRVIKIGAVPIGAGNPVAVQSMTNTATSDVRATVNQIKKLEQAGCEIIRVAVPDVASTKALKKIGRAIKIPLVADIHFDYKLAIESINNGADKIRINPGNIGSNDKTKQVIQAAKKAGIPVRIGINSGSIKRKSQILSRDMVSTALDYIRMFEDWDFHKIVVSLKTSDVKSTIDSYMALAKKTNYPLHLGLTESGPPGSGTIKSALGIGILLFNGIGDTIRVSLTGNPVEEVSAGYRILQALTLRSYGIDLISCPTCARCSVGLAEIMKKFENDISGYSSELMKRFPEKPLKVAVMGCEVNGPGEARHADIGIAGGKHTGLLFKKGKPVRKVPPGEWVRALISEIRRYR
ncbi:MAG: 4-hydroxy-3-methylbut-2-en-1-yl diphosphate synthase [Elusimicrobia bacterium RIFOXYB2_FULL_48_7]|nr:MAG: 4-hydroxy-3-methylbut-2-en-1-yl diphosphate synthase [Elusimicrobia bacterium RIFOXYB2_FULL_48_7]